MWEGWMMISDDFADFTDQRIEKPDGDNEDIFRLMKETGLTEPNVHEPDFNVKPSITEFVDYAQNGFVGYSIELGWDEGRAATLMKSFLSNHLVPYIVYHRKKVDNLHVFERLGWRQHFCGLFGRPSGLVLYHCPHWERWLKCDPRVLNQKLAFKYFDFFEWGISEQVTVELCDMRIDIDLLEHCVGFNITTQVLNEMSVCVHFISVGTKFTEKLVVKPKAKNRNQFTIDFPLGIELFGDDLLLVFELE